MGGEFPTKLMHPEGVFVSGFAFGVRFDAGKSWDM